MMRSIGKIIMPLAALILFATGCSRGSDDSPVDPVESGLELRLDIRIAKALGGSGLRAPSSETGLEPGESLEHLRVIIVDKSNGVIVHNRGIVMAGGGVSLYDDMRFKVEHSSDYDIYLLGNCNNIETLGAASGFGAEALPEGSVYPAGKIEDALIGCEIGKPMIDNSGKTVKGIPITAKYTIRTDDPSGEEHQIQSASFIMTRAAVKFSFKVKMAEDFIGAMTKKLTAIRISSLSNSMYLLPRDAVYYDNDPESEEGIIGFSVPEEAERGGYDFLLPGGGLAISSGNPAYEWDPLLYFPESSLAAGGFFCTLIFGNGTSALVPVKLPNLPYGLPRNTHVKLEITLGNNNSLQVKVKVLPWDQITSEFNFSDEVGIGTDGALRFIAGTYFDLNKETGRLILKNNMAAMGSFGLATPKGARWDAYLITESGKTDAIRFVLEDGSTTTRLSGIIDDQIDNFEIQSVFPPGNEANTAILQIIVTTDDGRGIPINILVGAGYGTEVKNLTVIQNPK